MTEKRIFVPLDGSSESEAALPYASAIALAVGAKLRLISVIDTQFAYLVTATRGRGGLQRWALGSVADKVMRLCHRPTLLIRPPAESAPPEVRLERLAVPLDGSLTAEQALPLAVELAASNR